MKFRPLLGLLAAVAAVTALGGTSIADAGVSAMSALTPSVKTGTASAITGSSAALGGTVNPRGSVTTAYFQWGRTVGYGSSTPPETVDAGNRASVAANLSGLSAGTTYHYRLVARNESGTSYGADQAFTTLSGPSPTPTATTPPPGPSPSPSSTLPPAGIVCANPIFTTSASNGGISNGGYYVHNNLWNAAGYPGTTGTTQVCSYRSWNHIGTATNTGDGAVKTYPNVHKDYSGRTIASFPRLTSTFAATSPGVGIYNVAYDLWLNGVPNDEVMIWTDNRNQVPAGSRFASNVSLSGRTWDLYATSGNGYIAFVPANGARYTSGTLDLKAMLNYLVAQGRVAANATVDQICYGVEIVDTGGSPATWRFTDFSITDS